MDKVAYVDDITLNGKTIRLEPRDFWVRDHVTEIILDCEDPEPHPSGDEEVCYIVSYDLPPYDLTDQYCDPEDLELIEQPGHEGEWCCVPAPETIIFVEDSLHDLEWFCRDAVDKKSEIDIEWFKVDSTPPIIEKTVIGPQVGQCNPIVDNQCWIKDWKYANGTTIQVDAYDNETLGCAVDEVTCDWWYFVDGTPYKGQNGLTPPFNITFNDETEHELHINCTDALGNWYEDIETFYVDSSGPNVTKEFIGPKHEEPGKYGIIEWIDGVTLINLTAEDEPEEPCAVGEDKIYYINTLLTGEGEIGCWEPETHCNPVHQPNPTGDGWTEYTTPFNKSESCHKLEYYAVDKLGNIGPVYANCFFVDKTEPTLEKDIIGPQVGDCPPEEPSDVCYVRDHVTNITLNCTDEGPHPSNHETIWYRILLDGGVLQDWTENGDFVKVTFTEDSNHTIEYYCVDAVNKSTDIYNETFKVDSTPPIINKTVGDPQYYNSTDGFLYLRDHVTPITIDAYDNETLGCAVDNVTCEWFIYLDSKSNMINSSQGFVTPPFIIVFTEDSLHYLDVHCKDELGNDVWDNQTFKVDSTPPVTTKRYEGPQYPEQGYPKWINSSTLIYLESVDNTTLGCAVGGGDIYWRNNIVDPEYCWNQTKCQEEAQGTNLTWNLYTGPFNKPEESCHLIEYYSVDLLGNGEQEIKKQCVFVDNKPPEPKKEVGEPKAEWDGSDAHFYDIAGLCGTEIDCWKVTRFTPISLNCTDPTPHPVDHEIVCFNVEVDACDETEDYCEEYSGDYNVTGDGFCCLNTTIEDFHFMEETEHNLKYYCIDALGNSNKDDVDEEKFKVEGTKFEIPLFKKWNLISVPFVLLDKNPEVVFSKLFYEDELIENVSKYIDSVWTHDPDNGICPQEWCVWSPGEAPGNLTIKPGWGYWVLLTDKPEDCEEGDLRCWPDEEPLWLVIGGSLFSPATTPPSRELQRGWNLVGYYGASWEIYHWDDFNFVCGDAFRFLDRWLYGDKVYCALNSLIDTQEGYPRWSAVWSYINCGDHVDAWLGLNACADQSLQQLLDRMYAGRGYWVEMDVPDLYSPATTCIWNDDFQCRWTGGGIIP